MDKKKPADSPAPSSANRPYNRTERHKNRIKLDDSGTGREYSSREAFDTGAEDILVKPEKRYDDGYEEEPLPPAKEPVSAKRRKLKRILFYIITIVIVLSVCSLLSLTVFFKIDDIVVEGETRYSHEEIIAASMINKNDNLILCHTAPGEGKIVEKFPYVEKADIQKKLFNKIIIKITEAKPSSIIESDGKYYVLSRSGKIIEIDEEKLYDVPIILGAKLKDAKICDYAKYENENIEKYIKEIMTKVTQYKIKNIATIDVTSPTNIILFRKNGFKLIIGAPENLDYKFKTAKAIMEENVSDNDIGMLDVSTVDSEGARSYFKSKLIEESQSESSKPKEESRQESSRQEASAESSHEESSRSEEESSAVEESSQELSEYTEDSDSEEESAFTEESDSEEESAFTEESDDEEESDSEYDSEYTDSTEDADSDSDDTEYTEDSDDDDNSQEWEYDTADDEEDTEYEYDGGDETYTDEEETD